MITINEQQVSVRKYLDDVVLPCAHILPRFSSQKSCSFLVFLGATVHIAASEGNLAAIRVLSECGADLSVRDRWKNSIKDEAERANAVKLLEFLETVDASQST